MTWPEWLDLFPDGFPDFSIATDSLIDIAALLPNIAKGQEKLFRQWASTKNAEIAQERASCRTMGVFPLLNALLTVERGSPAQLAPDRGSSNY